MVDAQCQASKPNCFVALELRIDSIAPNDVTHVTATCQSRGEAEAGVQPQSAMSQHYRLPQPFAGLQVELRQSSEKTVICGEVLWSPLRRHCNFCLKQLRLNG